MKEAIFNIVFHTSVERFSHATVPFMVRQETLHCKHFGIIGTLKKAPERVKHALLIEVRNQDEVVGVAARIDPKNTLFIGPMPRAGIDELIDALLGRRISISELQGLSDQVEYFIDV